MSTIHHQIYSDSPNKPWILLIHGLFGSLDNLSGLRKLFSDKHQVLSIDLPDHGKSAFTEKFNFDDYAHKIIQLIKDLNIPKLDILGHSLGGKVAMKIALLQADLVSHLIVLDIAPVRYSDRHSKVFSGLCRVDLNTLQSRQQADSVLSKDIHDSSTRQFLLKSLYNNGQGWQWRFNLNLLKQDYAILSDAIQCETSFNGPTLFIKGGNSDYLQLGHKPAILKLFPYAQSKIMANTGHWLHAENPKMCYKLVNKFLGLKPLSDEN